MARQPRSGKGVKLPGPTFPGSQMGPLNPFAPAPPLQAGGSLFSQNVPQTVGPLQNLQNPPNPSGTRKSKGPVLGVDKLKKKISKLDGFARNNLFIVDVFLPLGPSNDYWFKYSGELSTDARNRNDYMRMLARGVTLPGSQISSIDVPYRGQVYKMPGDRMYEPITITFMNDQRHTVRNTFFDWHKILRDRDNNYMWNTDEDNVNFYGALEISCLYRDKWKKSEDRHRISTRMKFHRAFPTIIGAVELDYGTNDQIQEFTVQFEYERVEFKKRGDDGSGIS